MSLAILERVDTDTPAADRIDRDERIRELHHVHGYSQRAIADELGCGRATVQRVLGTYIDGRQNRGNPNYRWRDGAPSLLKDGQIICWDGEGITVKSYISKNKRGKKTREIQPYVLLANSLGYRIASKVKTPDSFEPLSTYQCLGLIMHTARKHPGALHVIFGGAYDVNNILRDLGDREIRWLKKRGCAYFGPYQLEYKTAQPFKITDRRDGTFVQIWDVIEYLRTNFADAAEPWLEQTLDSDKDTADEMFLDTMEDIAAEASYDYQADLAVVRRGKEKRSKFQIETIEELRRMMRHHKKYNAAELRLFAAMMEPFRDAFVEAGYLPSRRGGPGTVAQVMLNRHNVSDHMARVVIDGISKEDIPWQVRAASLHAKAGGRNDPIQIGYAERPIWFHDITSAYPAALLHLPSLKGGQWQYWRDDEADINYDEDMEVFDDYREPFALYHVRYAFDPRSPNCQRILPFFFRWPTGNVSYPYAGEGWYWSPEIQAALKHVKRGWCIDECYYFVPATDEKPFAWVREVAKRRTQYKAVNNPAHIPLKHSYNSIPGKLGQNSGVRKVEHNWKIPTFQQTEWYGYVTSHVRARIYDAAMQAPNSVVLLATDGIYSTDKLDLPQGNELGEWTTERYDGMLSIGVGTYFVWNNKDPSRNKHRHRSFKANSISIDRVREAYRNGEESLSCPFLQFVTYQDALARGSLRSWRSWETSMVPLSLYPHWTRREIARMGSYRKAADKLICTKPPVGLEHETKEDEMSAMPKLQNRRWWETLTNEPTTEQRRLLPKYVRREPEYIGGTPRNTIREII